MTVHGPIGSPVGRDEDLFDNWCNVREVAYEVAEYGHDHGAALDDEISIGWVVEDDIIGESFESKLDVGP